jgi:hypothetical protein
MKNKDLLTYGAIAVGVLMLMGNKSLSGINGSDYDDPDMVRELELYGENDGAIYRQRRRPILVNLSKKYKKGQYDVTKAAKLWMYYIEDVMQKYHREYGSSRDKWFQQLSMADRKKFALELAKETKAEFDLGNFID